MQGIWCRLQFLLTESTSTWRMTKWSVNERAIEPINHKFCHGGIAMSDWFSDKLFTGEKNKLNRLTGTKKKIADVPVHCVQHFNGYQYWQGHCHWMWIVENFAVNTTELVAAANASQVMCQLPVGHLWTIFRVQEPPWGSSDSSSADITTNGHVTVEWVNEINKFEMDSPFGVWLWLTGRTTILR